MRGPGESAELVSSAQKAGREAPHLSAEGPSAVADEASQNPIPFLAVLEDGIGPLSRAATPRYLIPPLRLLIRVLDADR